MSDTPDPRNMLNDLSNRQWLKETKSFWLSQADEAEGCGGELAGEFVRWLRETREPEEVERLLGQLDESFVYSKTPPRSKLKSLHPATFSELDIERLIRLFTKQGETVMDPFVGSGSALIACAHSGRRGLGVELSEHWADVARRRMEEETSDAEAGSTQAILEGDACEQLALLEADSVDFVVTSPPYWSILTRKAGMKAKAERVTKGLPTQYSADERDLGNIESYESFLSELAKVFAECGRVLKPKRYMAVVVSDFRYGPRFYLFHSDLAAQIEAVGFALKGVTILAQDNKNLYPFGIMRHFVSNIHHQYILVFQKPDA